MTLVDNNILQQGPEMGQYIDKSNSLIRWTLVAANFVTLVVRNIYSLEIMFVILQILCLAVVSVGVWTIGFKSFISGLLTDRLFLSCAYLQVTDIISWMMTLDFSCIFNLDVHKVSNVSIEQVNYGR